MNSDTCELLEKYRDNVECDISVYKISPSKLDSYKGTQKDIKKIQFEILNLIYVSPLLTLLDQVSKKKKVHPLQNINLNLLSIEDRVLAITKILLKFHIKQKMIDEIIPNERDIKILFEAGKYGFDLNVYEFQTLNSSDRVERAQSFLKNHEQRQYQKQLNYDYFK